MPRPLAKCIDANKIIQMDNYWAIHFITIWNAYFTRNHTLLNNPLIKRSTNVILTNGPIAGISLRATALLTLSQHLLLRVRSNVLNAPLQRFVLRKELQQ